MSRYLYFFVSLLLIALTACSEQKAPEATLAGGSDRGRITGTVFGPLSDTYVYIYKEGMDLYGPAFAVSEATGVDGGFDLVLPGGDYVMVARKRSNGDTAGPVNAGDNKSDFIRLKVTGDASDVNILAPLKVGDSRRLADKASATRTGISGLITDVDGNPVENARVHVYDHVQMSERPKFVSERTGPDGRYLIYLPEGGTYYLCARDKFGGPPKLGDLYGRYDQGTIEPSAIVVQADQLLQNVDITVTKVW